MVTVSVHFIYPPKAEIHYRTQTFFMREIFTAIFPQEGISCQAEFLVDK
jgi:hypothetical protein